MCLQPCSLALASTRTHAHAPAQLRTHAEPISEGCAQSGNCVSPSKWKEGPRKTRERREEERGNIYKTLLCLFFFVYCLFVFLRRRLTWQWSVIVDGLGRTPVIRVSFYALWTRVGKFYLLIFSPDPSFHLCACAAVGDSLSAWECGNARQSAGKQRRWPAPRSGCPRCQVHAPLLCVLVRAAAVSGQSVALPCRWRRSIRASFTWK